MLMGHPPQIIAWSRENAPQGCFDGLMPVQVSMVVEELVAYDSEVQEALADTLESELRQIVQTVPAGALRAQALRQLGDRLVVAMTETSDLGERYRLRVMQQHVMRLADDETR
jgi:hypothetical protein